MLGSNQGVALAEDYVIGVRRGGPPPRVMSEVTLRQPYRTIAKAAGEDFDKHVPVLKGRVLGVWEADRCVRPLRAYEQFFRGSNRGGFKADVVPREFKSSEGLCAEGRGLGVHYLQWLKTHLKSREAHLHPLQASRSPLVQVVLPLGPRPQITASEEPLREVKRYRELKRLAKSRLSQVLRERWVDHLGVQFRLSDRMPRCFSEVFPWQKVREQLEVAEDTRRTFAIAKALKH
jgi:hypothetical protein